MPSIYQIAEKIGCHYTTVSRLRSGKRLPSPELLVRMCSAFDWDLSEAVTVFATSREQAAEYISTKLQELPEEDEAELP